MRTFTFDPNLRLKTGAVLRRLRTERGFSQAVLGERSRVSQDTISMVERGLPGLSFETFMRLAAGLEIRPSELLAQIEQPE
jgi:transcriptional regulator with XRE-family HTH domain